MVARLHAFSTPEGHYECPSLPFGLQDAPSCFHQVMSGLIGRVGLIYLDDITVVGATWEEHSSNLVKVLERPVSVNLSFK